MKSKSWLALALAFVCLFSVFSCGKKNGEDNQDNPSETVSGDFIYADGSTLVLVYEDGAITSENFNKLYKALNSKKSTVLTATSSVAAAEHEIVLGHSEREISKTAYKLLDRMEAENEDYVGYCIYSDGKSVAIAYDDEIYGVSVAENEAIKVFVEKYLAGDTLKMDKGTASIEKFDAIERQEELDQVMLDVRWAEVEEKLVALHGEKLGRESVTALKNYYYSLFTDELVTWFANLYDPVTGGFYFSNSARNSEGFLPDVESTAQALGFLTVSGITDDLSEFIPKEMQQQMVRFVKSLQSPENGHFYHPQWGKELTDKYPARLGREDRKSVV